MTRSMRTTNEGGVTTLKPTAARSDPARPRRLPLHRPIAPTDPTAQRSAWVAIAITLALGAANVRGATIYRENFTAASGMTTLSTFGWTAYYGNATTGATPTTSGSTGLPANAMVSGGPSAPSPGPNVNASASGGLANGFVALLSQEGAQDFLVYTDGYAIDRTTNVPAAFQWYAGSYFAGDAQRLAVRVNGDWYARSAAHAPVAFGNAAGGQGFGPGAQQIVAPFSADGWVAIDFTPGAPLTLGTTALTLPDGAITAFGLYAELGDVAGTRQERTFFDTFEATTAAPEPATLAALVGVGAILTRRGRR